MASGVIIAAAVLWLGLMFGVAQLGERRAPWLERHWPVLYALSLAVYCTSWTFYGTVTQAARYQWPLPPTFVGTIALYVLGFPLLLRVVALARQSHATSLADFIAGRLGKDSWLAAAVTAVAVLGLIPYIALQLKAVSMSYGLLSNSMAAEQAAASVAPAWQDPGLLVAMAMGLFAMLFGTRQLSTLHHNRGLVLAIAFESLFKLVAMLAVGVFVLWQFGWGAHAPLPRQPVDRGGFAPLVLLGVLAMFTLPHQFHMGMVECRQPAHVRTARWLFPLYMVLISVALLPLARAGDRWLRDTGISSDLYVLALPLLHGHDALALFAFLGGLSAATGMIVVSTLTLSVMIGHHWIAPLLVRRARSRDDSDLRGLVLWLRRAGIAAIVLAAWGYGRGVAGNAALADVGAVSFSALATLAPAVGHAIWRPATPPRAVTAGIVCGFAVWVWVVLAPLVVAVPAASTVWAWLSPDGFFGLSGWSRLARGVGSSLAVAWLTTWALALLSPRSQPVQARGFDAATLRHAGRLFIPGERLDALLHAAPASGPVPAAITAGLERELAAVLGNASARLLLDAARRDASTELETVAAIVDEARQDLRFNQRLLEAALENMTQGISVTDGDMRLVAWNRRYAELFSYPAELLQVGRPVADLMRHNLQARLLGEVDVQQALDTRLRHMQAATPYVTQRRFSDGTIVEIRGNPMPGGGFVATFSDVTAFRETERALMRSNETLELRVQERTSSLDLARRQAEQANDAKSRFLAAVGHDLLQPLHAAHLFTDALDQQLSTARQRDSVRQLRGALDSTTDLLTSLLDMSRLEAGGLVPEPRMFALSEVLDPLASEFAALAGERGLTFRYRPTRTWTHSDPQLLRRVLQNFLANAVRYTDRGGILLGVRRSAGALRIEVHDTGPGIAPHLQRRMFEEFRRGRDARGQGLGLGLSIAERIAGLLESPIHLHSRPGRGTLFGVQVPARQSPAGVQDAVASSSPGRRGQARILLVDNDPQALAAQQAVLEGWGHAVLAAADEAQARRHLARQAADVWVLDYHLDHGDTGIALHARLARACPPVPTLIVSADANADVRREVNDAGLSLLAKPLKPLALKSVLDRLLAAGRYQGPPASS